MVYDPWFPDTDHELMVKFFWLGDTGLILRYTNDFSDTGSAEPGKRHAGYRSSSDILYWLMLK